MNSLTVQDYQLPTTPEELSKFALLGPEKLKVIKAEINALKKLNLAEEVYSQKLEEQRILSGLLLDVYAKLGELTGRLPKSPGVRTDLVPTGNGVDAEQTKTRALSDLGFSRKQAREFETLSENKDLIEQEKAKATEEGRPASRSRVLDLAQKRKKREEEETQKSQGYSLYMDFCKKTANQFVDVLYRVSVLKVDEEHLKAWKELMALSNLEMLIAEVNESIPKLLRIQKFLKELRK